MIFASLTPEQTRLLLDILIMANFFLSGLLIGAALGTLKDKGK